MSYIAARFGSSQRERKRGRGAEEDLSGQLWVFAFTVTFPLWEDFSSVGVFFLLGFARQRYHPSATTQLQIAWWKFQRTLLICRVNFFLPLRDVIIHAAVVERVKRLIKQLPLFNGLTLKTPISHLTSYSIEQLF